MLRQLENKEKDKLKGGKLEEKGNQIERQGNDMRSGKKNEREEECVEETELRKEMRD